MSAVKGPMLVSLDITNKCNYRCLHCYNNSGENSFCNNELSDDEIDDLIDQVIKFKPYNLCFCGGEPLLRSDILLKSLKKLVSNNISCVMVSNGFFLTEELAYQLKEAGIRQIQISLDGQKESHNKLRGHSLAFDKAVLALEILKKVGIQSGIAFSPTKWNIDDFEYVYSIATKYNVAELRLQQLMPIGRAIDNDILPTDAQYRVLRKKIFNKNIEYNKNKVHLKVEWGDPVDHLITLSNLKQDTKYYTESISFTADGGITPSIYLPMTLGNIRKYSFEKYWDSGLDTIWTNPRLLEITKCFSSVDDMNTSLIEIDKKLKANYLMDDFDLVELAQNSEVTSNDNK